MFMQIIHSPAKCRKSVQSGKSKYPITHQLQHVTVIKLPSTRSQGQKGQQPLILEKSKHE